MKSYDYWIVDAFSLTPYGGNPAAVVFRADDVPDGRMQTIARHFNLSETVFLCAPEGAAGDYRARIFTPTSEIPFAGHPTVAAAFAHWHGLEDAVPGSSRLVQECGIGDVGVDVEERDGEPFFRLTAGAAAWREAGITRDQAASMLGCEETDLADLPLEVCSGGLPWLIVKVASLDVCRRLAPDPSLIDEASRASGATGVTTYCDGAVLDGVDHHVRSFAPGAGIAEDPACGSGTIALAIHMARHTRADQGAFSFTGEQGLEVGRQALLHIEVDRSPTGDLAIRLGGHAVRTMEGRLLG